MIYIEVVGLLGGIGSVSKRSYEEKPLTPGDCNGVTFAFEMPGEDISAGLAS